MAIFNSFLSLFVCLPEGIWDAHPRGNGNPNVNQVETTFPRRPLRPPSRFAAGISGL